MPTIADEAICVRHWDFSETSQTVSLLTRARGMLRGLAKGARRERGAFGGGIDLLTRGQVVAIVKPGRELATLTEWTLLQSWRVLRERLGANRAAFYAVDATSRMIVDEEPHPRSYDALVRCLDALADPGAIDAALVRLQWTLLEECGYRPRLSVAAAGAVGFSASGGGVVPGGTAGSWAVRRETIDLLAALAEGDDAAAPPPETARRAARLLAAYLRELMGFEPPTMRAVFPELPRRG